MFCGTFDCNVNKDRRLNIPAAVGGDINGDRLVLKTGENDCLEVHTEAEILLGFAIPEEIFVVKCDKRRIKIPRNLLKCNSFYFGRNVTLTGMGSYIRILPRPKSKR